MHGNTVLALLGAAVVGRASAGVAPETTSNPPGVIYRAAIEGPGFADADLSGELKGSLVAQAAPNGRGVVFRAEFENLPLESGPFAYHLHKAAVPADGNCTAALSHLDPYEAGVEVKCDASKPETCEVGDLSGKHGHIESSPFRTEYLDLYASTEEGNPAFFGDLSFVLHYANNTRLACANFMKEASSTPLPTGGYPNSTATHTDNPGATDTPEPTTAPSAATQASKWSWSTVILGTVAVALSL